MTKLEQDIRRQLESDADRFHRNRLPGLPTMSPEVGRRVRHRQTFTILLAATTATLVTIGAAWLVPSLPPSDIRPAGSKLAGSDVVEIPPPGQTEAVFLSDGSPAFVVAHEDGTTSVFDAFSGHVPWGLKKLIWWCPESRWFEDPFHGSKYDEQGLWRDGPAESGLGEYRVDKLNDGRLRVRTGTTYASPRLIGPNGVAVQPTGPPPAGPFCMSADEAIFHEFSEGDFTSVVELAASPDGWTVVRGTVVLEKNQPALLCESGGEAECIELSTPFFEDQELLVGVSPPKGAPDRRHLELPGPTWMALVRNGEIVDLAHVIPRGYEVW